MFKKPFKVPFATSHSVDTSRANDGPHIKRRKLSPACGDQPHFGDAGQSSSSVTHDDGVQEGHIDSEASVDSLNAGRKGQTGDYFTVLWRKPTPKKHKTWDGDGFLSVRDGVAIMYEESGKAVGRTKVSARLSSGSTLVIGGKDVEVDSLMTKEAFNSALLVPKTLSQPTDRELDEPLRPNIKANPNPTAGRVPSPDTGVKPALKPAQALAAVPSKANSVSKSFKSPLIDQDAILRPHKGLSDHGDPFPRHDPMAPGAVVMKRPQVVPKGKRVVDVVVDPLVGRRLRKHQKEGVRFLYESVMGFKPCGAGAILADQMGLGKTLQVIALIWTLMKQNPTYEAAPVVKKAVVVCPVTVVLNWKKEFRKWLGEGRVGVLAITEKSGNLRDFTHGRSYNVLVIGYEKFRAAQEKIDAGAGVDIIICDEGHRLKTAKNKAGQAVKSMKTEKKIVLSGTPLQNDLSELYFVSDLVNPGMLGKAAAFKREFEMPIARSTEPDATSTEIQKGQARSAELAEMTHMYILRRTIDILVDHLPPKTETVLFCKPTTAQAEVYRRLVSSPTFGTVLGNGSTETALQFISVLKKVCNTPALLSEKGPDEEAQKSDTIAELLSNIPSKLLNITGTSGKLSFLDSFILALSQMTDEKVVIVSHYTSTLNYLGKMLESVDLPYLRLDGSTPNAKRQGLVDRFNRTPAKAQFAFLLSAKSGGSGINLVGASRLILFDVDWNPSTEDQAMARIHRDGQKRHCRIYRFLVQGALDEKIYQRQLTKRALADSVVDGKQSATNFTRDELRRLFTFDESNTCQTHELLGCLCRGTGIAHGSVSTLREQSPPADVGSDDADIPPLGELMSGTQALHQQERAAAEARSSLSKHNGHAIDAQMQSLMQYLHIDPMRVPAEEMATRLDNDEVLAKALSDPDARVGYIFIKKFAKPLAAASKETAVGDALIEG